MRRADDPPVRSCVVVAESRRDRANAVEAALEDHVLNGAPLVVGRGAGDRRRSPLGRMGARSEPPPLPPRARVWGPNWSASAARRWSWRPIQLRPRVRGDDGSDPTPLPCLRPMDAELEGYAWLPRMIDNARAKQAGTLGSYVHPCPVDRRCLEGLRLDAATFGEVVAACSTDAEVLAELRRRGIVSAPEAWFDAIALEESLHRRAA
jgi:Domain of unknown function (DUF5069)